jgi:hypothetical protein
MRGLLRFVERPAGRVSHSGMSMRRDTLNTPGVGTDEPRRARLMSRRRASGRPTHPASRGLGASRSSSARPGAERHHRAWPMR